MTHPHPYQGRQAALATKHGKLAQIAPALRSAPGIDVVVANIDTDRFGTFTGEVPRPGDTLETAIVKARAGAEAAGLPLAIASEGSFGPHPDLVFVPGDLEIVVLVDMDLGYHVAEQVLTTDTNFAHIRLTPDQSPSDFAHNAGFPVHALVVQPSAGPGPVFKGITGYDDLLAAIAASAAVSTDGQALVQTDMRACYNPTRQIQIATAAERLATRLIALCPVCGVPGWGPIDNASGLPCEICQTPTSLTRSVIYGCPACAYRESHDVDKLAPAGRCPMCNP
ncbi:MAG: DUF6671 family protein [Acidimicrobiales bacterium]